MTGLCVTSGEVMFSSSFSFSLSSNDAKGLDAGGGSCCNWPPRYSMVFLRIIRRGQFILSWLQPFAHPPHRRAGIVGDVLVPPVSGVGLLDVDPEAEDPASCAALRLSSDHVRNSFWRIYLPLFSLRFMMINSQWFTLRRSSKYSTDQWYLDSLVSGAFKRPRKAAILPFHEENSRHQAMCDQHTHTGKVIITE